LSYAVLGGSASYVLNIVVMIAAGIEENIVLVQLETITVRTRACYRFLFLPGAATRITCMMGTMKEKC